MSDISNELLSSCMWLSSPSLPVGGFSWSQGLESVIEYKFVYDRDSLLKYMEGMIDFSISLWDLPFIKRFIACCLKQDADGFKKLDLMLKSGRGTKELYEEECSMGKALKSLIKSLGMFPSWLNSTYDYSYVGMFSLSFFQRVNDIDENKIKKLMWAYAFSWAQNQTSVACKTIPLGQTDAQKVLIELNDSIDKAVEKASVLEDDELGSALPGCFICSALHENQYSRLFRS